MTFSRLMTAFVIATSVGGSASMLASPAHAQNAIEAEIVGFHQLCEKGDRKACVRFGILIGRNEQRNADWRTPSGSGSKYKDFTMRKGRPRGAFFVVVIFASRRAFLQMHGRSDLCRAVWKQRRRAASPSTRA